MSLAELLVALAITALSLLITVPVFGTWRRHAAVIDSANELRSIFRLAQSRAIARHTYSGVKFAKLGTEWTYAMHDDGNRDGIRNDDITSGVDRCWQQPRVVFRESRLAHISLPANLSIKDPDGDALTSTSSAVQFGRSTICSFSPVGESTPGSIYVTDGEGELWCVRVYGATGKVRLLRYNGGSRKWERR